MHLVLHPFLRPTLLSYLLWLSLPIIFWLSLFFSLTFPPPPLFYFLFNFFTHIQILILGSVPAHRWVHIQIILALCLLDRVTSERIFPSLSIGREVHTTVCSTNFRAHLGLNFSNSFIQSTITEQTGFIFDGIFVLFPFEFLFLAMMVIDTSTYISTFWIIIRRDKNSSYILEYIFYYYLLRFLHFWHFRFYQCKYIWSLSMM